MPYVVTYEYEQRREGVSFRGRCRTDHALTRGEAFYAQHGRAIVVAIRPDIPLTPYISPAQARCLRALGR